MKAIHSSHYLIPDWPTLPHVKAAVSVQRSRSEVRQDLKLPTEPIWLNQIHSAQPINLDKETSFIGDAGFTQTQDRICVIETADCLPILMTDQNGTIAAAIHAGWRGLAYGIIDHTVQALNKSSQELLAWLGPAIGPDHFEVGGEVREVFLSHHSDYSTAFTAHGPEKFMANIYEIARINLRHVGITQVFGGGLCTYCDPIFYSYRRDKGIKGHMRTLIWLKPDSA